MESGLRSVSQQNSNELDWITGVFFLSDREFLDLGKVKQWNRYFGELIIAATGDAPNYLPEEVRWYTYDSGVGRTHVWNTIITNENAGWFLFIEDDEQLRFSSFPKKPALDEKQWAPAIIKQENDEGEHQFYQMRLINSSCVEEGCVFSGYNLPDATDFVRSQDIELMNKPILIERESNPHEYIDVDKELSLKNYAPKLYLVQGKRNMENKKYVRALAQFRQLLKKEKLMPFDRLAGVNGMASCMAEQHKWEKALSLTRQSLEAESLQRLPYLIQFRIHELRKEWAKAVDALEHYYDRLSLFSRANFDQKLDEEKTLVHLAEVSLKAGQRAQATDYLEKLFTFKRGDADPALLEKALLLSIDLNDYKRSVYLFERMFGDLLPPNDMDEEHREEIDEVMTMFMKQEWFDYVSSIYKRLHKAYPDHSEYKRKLIVTLTKTNRLDQAKKMVGNIV
jgi:tetratricopeptide (TPR) repeat protein